MDLNEYSIQAWEYGFESADVLYQSGEAVSTSASSPGGMEISAIVALLAGSSYLGYRKTRDFRKELENEYLSD